MTNQAQGPGSEQGEFPAELDPSGANAGLFNPYEGEPPPSLPPMDSLLGYPSNGNPALSGVTYTYNGMPVSRTEAMDLRGVQGSGLRVRGKDGKDRDVGIRDDGIGLYYVDGHALRGDSGSYTGESEVGDDGHEYVVHDGETNSTRGQWLSLAFAQNRNFLPALTPVELPDLKVNNAFGDASTALSARQGKFKKCADFFTQGRSLDQITQIFQNLWNTTQSFPSSFKAIAGTLDSGRGMKARIRLYAPFFADDGTTEAGIKAGYYWSPARSRYEELFTGFTPRQYRALTILHEFAHALDLIPSDKNSKDQSQKNDEIILKHCGNVLGALPN